MIDSEYCEPHSLRVNYEKLVKFVKALCKHGEYVPPDDNEFMEGFAFKHNEINRLAEDLLKEIGELENA